MLSNLGATGAYLRDEAGVQAWSLTPNSAPKPFPCELGYPGADLGKIGPVNKARREQSRYVTCGNSGFSRFSGTRPKLQLKSWGIRLKTAPTMAKNAIERSWISGMLRRLAERKRRNDDDDDDDASRLVARGLATPSSKAQSAPQQGRQKPEALRIRAAWHRIGLLVCAPRSAL